MAAAAAPQTDTLTLSDGTNMELARVPNVDDATWDEVKNYLEDNPEMARNLQKFSTNPEAIRGWLQTQAIAEHYNTKLQNGDAPVQDRVKALEQDPELAHMFEDIKQNGLEAALKYHQDEELMRKVSKKMGGVPDELKPVLQRIDDSPLTFHESCKNGDLRAAQQHLATNKPIDVQDHKGVTALGYAIGANRIAVAKLLLDCRANPYSVDSAGNSGLHYAAGYGRRELLEYLLEVGANVNQPNAQGQTPMAVATMNRQTATVEILQQIGAR